VKKRLNEFVGLWLALGILALVAVLAYRSTDGAAETLGWVEHTNETLRQIAEVSAAYARATSARRAFTVGGDPSQLADVPDLDARMTRALAAVRDSVADDPAELRRLDTLEKLLKERLAGLDGAVETSRRSGLVAETAEGLALTARIRAVREEMEGEENRLLAVRDARTRRDIRRTKAALLLGTLASFTLLLVAFAQLRREILGRLASEQALRRSERFLDSIIENIPDMIFVKEAGALRFERINRAGEELLGVERKELLGKNDFDFFPRAQAEFFQARDRDSLRSSKVEDIPEEPIATKSGERWLHTKKVPVLGEGGEPRYLLGISEDITESRKSAAALKAAKDAAEAANKELEAFSYSVAHDLRAPLRAIDGFSQAIQEDCGEKLDSEAIEYLGRVRGAARHMGELIDGLLSLSRLVRGELLREKVDLTLIAQQSGARLTEAHPERSVELVVDPGLEVDGDARLLAAALDNLMSNAWKFTGKRDRARVEVGRRIEEGKPVYFVRDNGAGFEQAYAHKLFGAFQRLHTVTEFEGTGIGLATVQRIVRRHGGRVWAEGEVGRGATFFFTL
jgi:PAS domain S-box-containing protein